MVFNENLEPKGKKGKRLRILSIDGGGVRGIIPARILEELERYLKEEERKANGSNDGSNETTHHLWEYFDVIAGTSSGGLITALITIPGDQNRPCNAKEAVAFFKDDADQIFPTTFTDNGLAGRVLEGIKSVLSPIYSADTLETLLQKKFGEARLSQALTSVIIPAFDTATEVPVFFSNLKADERTEPLYNVKVKDACRATTAAPIFFPAANFKEVLSDGSTKDFSVIDGGIAINDPDFSNILVLSLGTGQHPMRFLAMSQWNSLHWLLNRSGLPLLNSFLSASEEIEYYTSMLFDAHQSGDNYLRIQTDCLSTSEFLGIDDARPENLGDLEEKANKLLEGDVSKRNFATGKLDAKPDGGKNDEALQRFARWLVEERKHREA
jgi:hypothetical protein